MDFIQESHYSISTKDNLHFNNSSNRKILHSPFLIKNLNEHINELNAMNRFVHFVFHLSPYQLANFDSVFSHFQYIKWQSAAKLPLMVRSIYFVSLIRMLNRWQLFGKCLFILILLKKIHLTKYRIDWYLFVSLRKREFELIEFFERLIPSYQFTIDEHFSHLKK